jgi:hypothetical protein
MHSFVFFIFRGYLILFLSSVFPPFSCHCLHMSDVTLLRPLLLFWLFASYAVDCVEPVIQIGPLHDLSSDIWHHEQHSSLHSSLVGSQHITGLNDQALLIHCLARNFLTVQYVLSINAFCDIIYRAGRRLSSFKLSCNLFGIIPAVDSTCVI